MASKTTKKKPKPPKVDPAPHEPQMLPSVVHGVAEGRYCDHCLGNIDGDPPGHPRRCEWCLKALKG